MAPQENCRTKAAWCRGAALVVLLTGALVGCNSGDGSRQAETSPPAVTGSASSSPAPTAAPAVYKPADATGPAQNVPVPVLPEVAKTETKEGLEAFAKYWFELLSYGYETGHTESLVAASGPDCTFCHGLAANISSAWSEQKWISGGQIEIPTATATMPAGQSQYVTLQVLQKELVIHDSDGSPYQEPTAATNAGSRMTATFGTGGWIVSDLGLIR